MEDYTKQKNKRIKISMVIRESFLQSNNSPGLMWEMTEGGVRRCYSRNTLYEVLKESVQNILMQKNVIARRRNSLGDLRRMCFVASLICFQIVLIHTHA